MDNFIKHSSAELWQQVSSKVKDAVIFIDDHSAECLHWSVGGDALFDAGAKSIKELSSFESGSTDEAKAVFIVSSPVVGKTAATIQDIIQSSKFKECIVITSLAAKVHQYAANADETHNEDNFFETLENELSGWMSCKDAIAAVIHLPLFITPIFDNLFLTPGFDVLFPIQQKDLLALGRLGEGCPASLSDLHFYMLPEEYRILIRMLSSSFRNYFHMLGCKEEIFSIGPTSHVLSVQLSNLSNQHKTAYPNQVGVLFIDRTADPIGPVSYSEKSLIDQLLAILPGLPGHYNNVSIDMSSICSARCEEDDGLVYSGCLVTDETNLLSESYHAKSQEAVNQVTEKLIQAVEDEGIDEDTLIGSDKENPAERIRNLVSAFAGNPGAILYNSSLLQFGLAISQMMSRPDFSSWQTMATKQKLILQQMGEDGSIIKQILQFLQSDGESTLSFEDVCCLLIYSVYGFKKSIDPETYEGLCNCVIDRISKIPFDELPESFTSTFKLNAEDLQNKNRLTHIAYSLMNFISDIDVNNLRHFKILKFSDVEPPSYQPLLTQLMERIFDSAKPELEPDVEHISTGRKDLLKMGISMFRKVAPPRPSDFKTLFVYVVGGITATEVAQMNEVLKRSNKSCRVFIGSNRLISPSDLVDKVLFSNNLNPDVFC